MPVSMDILIRDSIQLMLKDSTRKEASRDAAKVAGQHAARLGWNVKQLENWLSTNYGRVWVKETQLNPGLNLKDVRRYALETFKKAGGKMATTKQVTRSAARELHKRGKRKLARATANLARARMGEQSHDSVGDWLHGIRQDIKKMENATGQLNGRFHAINVAIDNEYVRRTKRATKPGHWETIERDTGIYDVNAAQMKKATAAFKKAAAAMDAALKEFDKVSAEFGKKYT